MDLRDCLRAVRRRLWLVGGAVAVARSNARGLTTMAVSRLGRQSRPGVGLRRIGERPGTIVEAGACAVRDLPADAMKCAPAPVTAQPLTVVVVLKTAEGGLWILPHVDELRRRGHRVVMVLPSGGRLREALLSRGVPVHDSAFSFRFRAGPGTLRGLWRLRRQLRELAPDVVHYCLYASALAARLSTVLMRVARVHMVAGPLYLDSGLIRHVERFLARLDHVTIGGSAYTSERYRRLGRAVAATPAVPFGLDTEAFRPCMQDERAAARSALGLAPDELVVVMVAYVYAPKRLVYKGRGIKGHDVLLRAWDGFRGRHAKVRLLLVGGGFDEAGEAHRRDLMAQFRVEGDPTVRWLPVVADVRGYYAAADVSVTPSLSENHGAAREAGAMGIPSIVSDAGGLPETVDADSGWIVARDDPEALERALEAAYDEFHAGILGQRGAAARRHVLRRFPAADTAVQVADVIERAGRRHLVRPYPALVGEAAP